LTVEHYNERKYYYQNENAASREQRTIQELLAWLNYPGMDQRRDSIEKAYKNTLQWIFDDGGDAAWDIAGIYNRLATYSTQPESTVLVPLLRAAVETSYKSIFQPIFDGSQPDAEDTTVSRNPLTSESRQPEHDSFVTWLCTETGCLDKSESHRETGIFWIYGKPGAGKSTLMKYLADDPRLYKHASAWAGFRTLSVCVFHFWKHGSKTQNSLCGLYRALLWQMLKDDPILTRKAFPGWQMVFSTIEPRLEALKAALDLVLKAHEGLWQRRKKYLILIDGLDEYEDEERDAPDRQERLCEDIKQMVESGYVKIVIASRPDRAFESHFSHGRKVAVHDLSAPDLESYARARLLNDKTIRPSSESLSAPEDAQLERLANDIVRKSQGVFLWTRIVVDMARVHIRDHQDLAGLKEILDQLPPDLEKLFDQIMLRILSLGELQRREGLRYLAVTSRWYAAFADHEYSGLHLLPVSILGVGCEPLEHNLTESLPERDLQRLAGIGHDAPRIEGRVKSYCFGLLETCNTPDGGAVCCALQTGPPVRKSIRPLHRNLVEYLSRHPAMQSQSKLSPPNREPFEANTAILHGLVVMKDCIYPLVSTESRPTSLFGNVLIFNALAERSTGNAQLAMLSAFDRTIKAGFADLVGRHCHLDHDHEARCASSSPSFGELRSEEAKFVLAFEELVLDFALNPSHPLTSKIEGFLDLLAITIITDSNSLLGRWVTKFAAGGDPLGAMIRAEYATRLLSYAMSKQRFQSDSLRKFSNDAAEPNIIGLQLLMRLGARLEARIDGASAWEKFLDDMLSRTMEYTSISADFPEESCRDSRVIWGLKALPRLIEYKAHQDVYRIWAEMIRPHERSSDRDFEIEFRRYSAAQVIRRIHDMLCDVSSVQRESHETRELGEISSQLMAQSGAKLLDEYLVEQSPRDPSRSLHCSWSDLQEAVEISMRYDCQRIQYWGRAREALAVARQTSCDIEQSQELRVGNSPPPRYMYSMPGREQEERKERLKMILWAGFDALGRLECFQR
jgi:cytidylate kinase